MINRKEIGEPLAAQRREHLLGGVPSYESFWRKVACARLVHWVLLRQRLVMVLCSTVWLLGAAAANAQGPSSNDANAAKIGAGWWSPKSAESTPAPQLMISMAELTRFDASDSYRTSPVQPSSHRPAQMMDEAIAGSQYFGSTPGTGVARLSLLPDPVSLSPTSVLSLLQTNYMVWESNLAESRSLTDVHGASVYPLLQISYASWHLPITLYIPPLRGSDAR